MYGNQRGKHPALFFAYHISLGHAPLGPLFAHAWRTLDIHRIFDIAMSFPILLLLSLCWREDCGFSRGLCNTNTKILLTTFHFIISEMANTHHSKEEEKKNCDHFTNSQWVSFVMFVNFGRCNRIPWNHTTICSRKWKKHKNIRDWHRKTDRMANYYVWKTKYGSFNCDISIAMARNKDILQ